MRAIMVVLVVLLAMPALAETLYVTDILRLGMHENADTSDRPFRMLVSGTPLEILERAKNYARVRAPDGREGWVKSNYLVDDKPSRLRVTELEAEVAKLNADLGGAVEARETAEAAHAQLTSEVASSTNSSAAVQAQLRELTEENEQHRSRLETFRGSVPLSWAGVALIVALAAGFLAGLWWIDFQSRRRHGGFRVY